MTLAINNWIIFHLPFSYFQPFLFSSKGIGGSFHLKKKRGGLPGAGHKQSQSQTHTHTHTQVGWRRHSHEYTQAQTQLHVRSQRASVYLSGQVLWLSEEKGREILIKALSQIVWGLRDPADSHNWVSSHCWKQHKHYMKSLHNIKCTLVAFQKKLHVFM